MSVEFVAPPPAKSGARASWFTPEVLAALSVRAGEWACIKRSAAQTGSAYTWCRRHPEFEVTTRSTGVKDDDGRPLFDVYARYVGGVSDEQ